MRLDSVFCSMKNVHLKLKLCREFTESTAASRTLEEDKLAFELKKHEKESEIAAARIAVDAKMADNEATRLRIEERKIELKLAKQQAKLAKTD